MDNALLLRAVARQRLINALALGISPKFLAGSFDGGWAGNFIPLLPTPPLIPLALPFPSPVPLLEAQSSDALATNWTPKEDAMLKALVAELGTSKWSRVASRLGSKTNRQCRRRWQAILSATGSKGSWTPQEDAKLLEGHRVFGNRWTDIARLVPGRTDNAVKNRFAALAAKGEGAKSPRAARWSDLCVAPDSAMAPALGDAESDDSSTSVLKRKASSDCLDSASVPAPPKRINLGISLDLNTKPEADVMADAPFNCAPGVLSPVTSSSSSLHSPAFSLDLNSPASTLAV